LLHSKAEPIHNSLPPQIHENRHQTVNGVPQTGQAQLLFVFTTFASGASSVAVDLVSYGLHKIVIGGTSEGIEEILHGRTMPRWAQVSIGVIVAAVIVDCYRARRPSHDSLSVALNVSANSKNLLLLRTRTYKILSKS
jgi:hypothetical protein